MGPDRGGCAGRHPGRHRSAARGHVRVAGHGRRHVRQPQPRRGRDRGAQGGRKDPREGRADRRAPARSLARRRRRRERQGLREGRAREGEELRRHLDGRVPREQPPRRDGARPRGDRVLRPAELHVSLWDAHRRGRDRRRDGQGPDRALLRVRRLRAADQPDDRRGTAAWRHRPGHRPGALRGRGVRRQWPAPLRKHDGVPRTVRRGCPDVQPRSHGDAHDHESPWGERHRRSRDHRIDAGRGQRGDRRALTARRQAHRHAAHVGEDLACDPRGRGGTTMITHPFTYQAPATIEEAVKQLGQSGDAKVIAGGHSLLPLMKLGLAQPEALVDLRRIASLREIRTEPDGTILIGALATPRDIAHNETVRAKLAALADAAGEIGDLQVRARGTMGGSLAHADPAADEPAPTLAYDATIRAIGRKGRRDIPAREYFKGTFETALAADEILAEIRFPAPAGRTGGAYAKFAHPASGFAVTGVAAVVTIKADGAVERAAIAVAGAAAAAYRATAAERSLTGTRGDAKAIAEAAAKAANGITALSDLAASADYRKHLVTVYAKRAIE